jgi:wobble nucleotide-excising tRNase
MLEKIIDVQKVGRFEKLKAPNSLRFSKVTLLFGENGWGKSTLADILRSFGHAHPDIVRGRETLATTGDQKIILLIDGRQALFDGNSWTGTPPPVAVFDQTFINENVFSGEVVSHDHLKRQYGLVVGADGVKILQSIQNTEVLEKDAKDKTKELELKLQKVAASLGLIRMSAADFVALTELEDAESVIAAKEVEVKRASERNQIQSATLPEILPLPTSSTDLISTLEQSLVGVSSDARTRLRAHIAKHAKAGAETELPHESWLEAGLSFGAQDECPFCGQDLRDRDLIDLYSTYFSAAFKELADEVKKRRQTLARYESGEFRRAVTSKMQANEASIENLTNLTKEQFNEDFDLEFVVSLLEKAARSLDGAFLTKQEDLVNVPDLTAMEGAVSDWKKASEAIEEYNLAIQTYRLKIDEIRKSQSDVNLEALREEFATLKARVVRFEDDTSKIVSEYQSLAKEQKSLKTQKEAQRKALKDYTETVTAKLGAAINGYLDRLGAGFRIDYQQPNFRGSEPAAAYQILIRDTPVSPRTDDISTPSFRNTLSTGDKSVLALALFLATVSADPRLSDMIVVLDDPFTSMDDFRRRFTANEINKLTDKAKQVIVLSHEKGFLRLLWEKIDRTHMTTCAIQTGAPGMASLAAFDIEKATRPRYETEREKVLQFLDVTEGDPDEIRGLLRTVLEDFYRKGDPELFSASEMLGGIIEKIKSSEPDYRYKGALEDLEDINDYTRGNHHAEVAGNASEPTSVEELKSYCRKVRDLTRGSV